MIEALRPDEKGKRICTFVDALEFFTEEEKGIAQFHIGVYRRMVKFLRANNIYNVIANFINEFIREKGNSFVRNCKLFHLYSFSSLPEKEWRELPMDTPDLDFDRFVREELIPLLEREEGKNES